LARALAPELVLELPELLEDELERDVDPELELWDELDPLDDRELLSEELKVNNTMKRGTTLPKTQQ
jgi:predicted nucleotidyltransferase